MLVLQTDCLVLPRKVLGATVQIERCPNWIVAPRHRALLDSLEGGVDALGSLPGPSWRL